MQIAEHKSGYLLAIGSAFFYAIQIILGKMILSGGVSAFDLLVVQYSFTFVILGLFILMKRDLTLFKINKADLRLLLIQGVIGGAGTSLLLYSAMERINAGIASLLLYLSPVFVCIFFLVTGIKKIGRANKIAVVLSFVGAFFVLDLTALSGGKLSVTGIVLGVVAGMTYAFFGIFADLKLRGIRTETMLFYNYLIGTGLVCLVNFRLFTEPFSLPDHKTLILLCISGLWQVFPMAFLNLGIRRIGSEKASIVITAELPFTLVLAFLVLGETMKWGQVAGVALIITAILVLQLKKEKEPEKVGK